MDLSDEPHRGLGLLTKVGFLSSLTALSKVSAIRRCFSVLHRIFLGWGMYMLSGMFLSSAGTLGLYLTETAP